MKSLIIKIPESKKKFKETEEERKERLYYWKCTRTRVKESKKLYKRERIDYRYYFN